jgi:two-component system chemotaxis response regulator CheY
VARTVLVVDDSTTAYQQLKKILDESGDFHVVGHAPNSEEAVRLFVEHKPDLVTMDIVMPGADGLATIKLLLEKDPKARVVVVSSMGGVKNKVVAALQAGARNVVPKPFEKDQVLQVLRAIK